MKTTHLRCFRVAASILCLWVSTVIILDTGCSRKSSHNQPAKPVRLAYIPYSADLPFFVAMENGYFKEAGVEVEPISCKSSSEALDLVLAGKADGAMGNSFSVLFSIHAKNPNTIRLVNVSVETIERSQFTGFLLVQPDSPIDAPEKLKGHRVGTEKGASQVLWVRLYLERLGLNPDTDVVIEQESPET